MHSSLAGRAIAVIAATALAFGGRGHSADTRSEVEVCRHNQRLILGAVTAWQLDV